MIVHGKDCHMYKAEPATHAASALLAADIAAKILDRDRDWNDWRVNDQGESDPNGSWIAYDAPNAINRDLTAQLARGI